MDTVAEGIFEEQPLLAHAVIGTLHKSTRRNWNT